MTVAITMEQTNPLPQRVRKTRHHALATIANDHLEVKQTKQICVNTVGKDAPQLTTPDAVAYANYEYLDHTADIQFHSWGNSLAEAFGNAVICMFNYMTEVETVEIDEACTQELVVDGHDLMSLLYNFMDEFLFQFCSDGFICKTMEFLEFDATQFRIRVKAKGERFVMGKHPQGTEIKAITYSNMQIRQHDELDDAKHLVDIYVIVDI